MKENPVLAAKSQDSSRPQFVIVFREASEKNSSLVANLLKASKVVPDSHSSLRTLALEPSSGGAVAKVFETLGVAVADLDDEQKKKLEKRDDVAVVAVNEVRFLPPVSASSLEGSPEGAGSLAPPSARGILPIGLSNVDPKFSPLEAYLLGVRDAANAALGFMAQSSCFRDAGALNPISSPAAESAPSWAISAMGLGKPDCPTGQGVKLAILDTGMDLSHRDFKRRFVEGHNARSFVKDISVQDVNGHGTHCAGVAGGPQRSKSGVRYGVAPDADLLIGKVFNNDPDPKAFDDDILAAMQWADENGARVISMSLGSRRAVNGPFAPAYESLAQSMLNRSSGGVLLFAAAGNESNRPFSTQPVGNPAACPSIFAVAAVGESMQVAPFSCQCLDNIGLVDISAPGVKIFSSYAGDSFQSLSGTSMATPHVAGLAALYFQSRPDKSATEIRNLIFSRSQPLGESKDFGAGFARL